MNTKEKGDVGVGQAISYYTIDGIEVLLPIGDKKPYDIVIDRDGSLHKIQIKYSASRNKAGNFKVDLRTTGGNQSFYTTKKYNDGDFDFCFIYTSEGSIYEIPYDVLPEKKNSVTLSNKYDVYKIR
jgi:hypothetical protein